MCRFEVKKASFVPFHSCSIRVVPYVESVYQRLGEIFAPFSQLARAVSWVTVRMATTVNNAPCHTEEKNEKKNSYGLLQHRVFRPDWEYSKEHARTVRAWCTNVFFFYDITIDAVLSRNKH